MASTSIRFFMKDADTVKDVDADQGKRTFKVPDLQMNHWDFTTWWYQESSCSKGWQEYLRKIKHKILVILQGFITYGNNALGFLSPVLLLQGYNEFGDRND